MKIISNRNSMASPDPVDENQKQRRFATVPKLIEKRSLGEKMNNLQNSPTSKQDQEQPPLLCHLSDSLHSASWSSFRDVSNKKELSGVHRGKIISLAVHGTSSFVLDSSLDDVFQGNSVGKVQSTKQQDDQIIIETRYKKPTLIPVHNTPALLFADDIFACSFSYPTVVSLEHEENVCSLSGPSNLDDDSFSTDEADANSEMFELQFVNNSEHDESHNPFEEEDDISEYSTSGCSQFSKSSSSDQKTNKSKEWSTISDKSNQEDVLRKVDIAVKLIALEKRYKQREKQLRKLSVGNKKYFHYLTKQEERVRKLKQQQIVGERPVECSTRTFSEPDGNRITYNSSNFKRDEQNNCINDSGTSFPPAPDLETSRWTKLNSDLKNVLGFMLDLYHFEKFHTVPGVLSLILYCIASTSVYNAITAFHRHFFSTSEEWTMHFFTLCFGILLCRCSGGIFEWLTDNLYEGAKFDLSNRLRLGQAHARLVNWVRKNKVLRQTMDLLGFYLCHMAIGRVIEEGLMPFICHSEGGLLSQLPSQKFNDTQTYSSEVLSNAKGRWAGHSLDWEEWPRQDYDLGVCGAESNGDLINALEEEDMEFLYEKLSSYSFTAMFGWGTDVVPIVSTRAYLFYHIALAIVSIFSLIKLGVGFSV